MLTALLLPVLSSPSFAQWSPNGVLIAGAPTGYGRLPRITSDGSGGAYVAWADLRDHLDLQPKFVYSPYITHLDALGRVYPGIPFGGVRATQPLSALNEGGGPLFPDGAGGVYVLTGVDSSAVHFGANSLNLVHLRGDCTPSPGWPSNGIELFPGTSLSGMANAIIDGSGGLFVVVQAIRPAIEDTFRLKLQHVRFDGSIDPGFPRSGRVIAYAGGGDQGQFRYNLAPDGHGGFFVGFTTAFFVPAGNYLQHILADGSIAPGFGPLGNRLAFAPPMIGMGLSQGGVICAGYTAGTYGSGDQVYWSMGFDSLGHVRPQWSGGPRLIMDAIDYQYDPDCLSDGQGGLFLAWDDYRNYAQYFGDRYLQHVGPDGGPASGWPEGGVPVARNPGLEFGVGGGENLAMVPDGTGGVYVEFGHEGSIGGGLLVSHMVSPGVIAPGWSPSGEDIATGSAPSQQVFAAMCSDGRAGAISAYNYDTFVIRAQHISPDAPVAAEASLVAWSAGPDHVSLDWLSADGATGLAQVERRGDLQDWQVIASLQPDGTGHLRHEDHTVVAGTRYAYRLRYTQRGVERTSAESWIVVPLAARFALAGARPDPAPRERMSVAFALEGASPARLELFGVDGRRVLAREVGASGAGEHTLQLSEGRTLAPGLYWLRLTQGSRTATKRVAVVE